MIEQQPPKPAPDPVINGGRKPWLCRVITPVKPIYFQPFIWAPQLPLTLVLAHFAGQIGYS